MRILFFIVALFIITFSFPLSAFGQSAQRKLPPKKPGAPSRLVMAQIRVESTGDDNALGDRDRKHKANGCLQIRKPCVDDFNKVYGTNYRAEDCRGNRELSILIHSGYMEIYATQKKIGRKPKDEDRARIWNGGPTGWKREDTIPYWKKVEKELRVGDASRSKGR